MTCIDQYISALDKLNFTDLYGDDFLLTWEKSYDEIVAVFTVADALRQLRESNVSTRIFDSGLGVSLFRNKSTRSRFSFTSACNLLGLTGQDLDAAQYQSKAPRDTANMVSFMADVIGIRDHLHIGKGSAYMREFAETLHESYLDGHLEQCPTVINLQCEKDHPTQTMADMNHLIRHFGGINELRGKKIAMTWASSSACGKPLSVPQGIIALMTRFGMDVHLAHPEGYDVMPEIEIIAKENAAVSGGTFVKSNSMQEAIADADIVYSRTWSPYTALEQRTELFNAGDIGGIKIWERELLARNTEYKEWECTDCLMKTTKDSNALYLHSPRANISGVSCNKGDVAAPVLERYRVPLYKQAGHKPYITAAMIFLAKIKHPQELLTSIVSQNRKRHL